MFYPGWHSSRSIVEQESEMERRSSQASLADKKDSSHGLKLDKNFKIVLLGDAGVGKSGILLRFTKDVFSLHTNATVGVEFASKTVQMENNKFVKADIWDTAGQERYRHMTSSYFRGAVGALVVYDVSDRKSFDHIPKWLREIEEFAEEDCLIMLVGNKVDLEEKRCVSLMDGRELATRNKIAFIETSALDNTRVDAAFQHLLQAIYNQENNKENMRTLRITPSERRLAHSQLYDPETIKLPRTPQNKEVKQGCCGTG